MPPKKSQRKAANGYRLPDPLPEGEIITGITKQKSWRLGKSIGVGGFGEIYLCSEDTKRKVGEDATLAMKIEPHENGPLFVEMNFYIRAAQAADVEAFKKSRKISGTLGFPVHRGSGSHVFKGDKYRFLVMDRYGKDLQSIFQSGKKLFSERVAFNLAIKILDSLEYIHSRGYVHNDIKAQNLLLGYGRANENDVYLVDFGLVSKYMRETVHLEYKPDARKAHDGTIEYTSRDAHIGAHSRRSDLEILGYNLVHWMSGNLPWMDNLTNPNQVQKMKNQSMSDISGFLHECFGENEFPPEIEEFMQYAIGLEFDTCPDYDKCRKLFQNGLKKRKFPLDGKIDFAAPKSPVKKVRTPMTPKATKAKSRSKARSRSSSPSASSSSESEAESPPPAKRSTAKKSAAKAKAKPKPKTTPAQKRVAEEPTYSSVGCQTSPAFVKAAKAAKRSKKSVNNPEMDEFVEKAVSSAKKAGRGSGARSTPKRRSGSSSRSRSQGGDGEGADDVFSNPTPAMKALLEKKAAKEAALAAKRKTSRSKK